MHVKMVFFLENYYKGGLDSFFINLVNNWERKDDEILVCANKRHPFADVYTFKINRDITVISYRNIKDVFLWMLQCGYPGRCVFFVLRYIFFIFDIFRLRKLLRGIDADMMLVINGGYPGGDSCRAATIAWGLCNNNKPLAIHNFHNLMVPRRKFNFFEDYIDTLVDRYTSYFVTVSETCLNSMNNRPHLGKKAKRKFIYNGIEEYRNPHNETQDVRSELGIQPHSKICLMLATYELRKGHDFLLRAFRIVVDAIPSAQLIMCGFGYPAEMERICSHIKDLRLEQHVHLLGFRDDAFFLLEQSDILVVPSQSFESFGLTCIEAMSKKVPVVATKVGGLIEVVANGEGGYCLEPDNVNGYAEKIIELLNNEQLRHEQGEKGYCRYTKLFTAQRMAKEYVNLIDTIRKNNERR